MTRRLVVIGNGMAATRLVQRLVERDPAQFAITVVGDEPHPAYNRIQLSPLLAGEKTAAQLPLLPAEWYTRHGVCLRSGEAAHRGNLATVGRAGVRHRFAALYPAAAGQ